MKAKPEFEQIAEFRSLATKIVEKYTAVFNGISVDQIQAVVITNKPKPDQKPHIWDVEAVKMPVRMDCPYGWYIIFHNDWFDFSEKQKLLAIAESLCAIPVGLDVVGKKNPVDYKRFSVMLRTFGVDYLDNPNIPHLLEDEVQWVRNNL